MNAIFHPPSSILNLELNNERHIYLYKCYSKGWMAYECSARNLHVLLPHISTYKYAPKGWNREVEALVVPQLSLDLLLEKNLIISHAPDSYRLIIEMPPRMLSKSPPP